MNVSAREWSSQYEALKRNIASKRINSHGFTSEEIKSITNVINNLDSQLKIMSGSPLQYEIAVSEIARRQVLVDNLKKQSFKSSTVSQFEIHTPPKGGSPKTYNPMNNTSDQGLLMRQKDMMALQDDMIVDIEKGVGRLHEKSLRIGDEARIHNRILTDLDTNVEIATAALQEEARHAAVIKDKAKVCWMYVCIAIEVIILFILIILAFV